MAIASKPVVSVGFCKPTLRGIARTQPELSWYAERMLSRHFELVYDEVPQFLFFGEAGNGEHLSYPSSTIRIFITGENVQANWDEADYALTHERLYSERHWRLPLFRHWYDTTETIPVRDFDVVRNRVDRFCNFIYSNERAIERIAFFDRLSRYKHVDAGGRVRNNLGYRVEDKFEWMARSKFTIAFENESYPGYATEKLIQPLLLGSIPVYWGDPTVELDINPDCLINVHNFASFDEVVEEVARIDRDPTLWERYVTAPIFRNGRIPDVLSDQAIVRFFRGVFDSPQSIVPRRAKMRQRVKKWLQGNSRFVSDRTQQLYGRASHALWSFQRFSGSNVHGDDL